MRKIIFLVFFICGSIIANAQQIYLAGSGLTATPVTGTSRTVSLGGTVTESTVLDYTTSTTANFIVRKATANYFYVDNTGKIGIGTITPTSLLSLSNTAANSKLAVFDNGTTLRAGLGWATGQLRLHLSATTDKFSFLSSEAAATDLMTILGTGNVGIGTATPANKLSIAGGTATNFGLQFPGLTNATTTAVNANKALSLDASGNVIWVNVSGPAGSTTEFQYRNSGAFGANSAFTATPANKTFNIIKGTEDFPALFIDRSAGVGDILKINPPNSFTGQKIWRQMLDNSQPNGNGTYNTPMRWGWFHPTGGNSIWYSMEPHYLTQEWIENHLEAHLSGPNANIRLFSSTLMPGPTLETSANLWFWQGSAFEWRSLTGNPFLTMQANHAAFGGDWVFNIKSQSNVSGVSILGNNAAGRVSFNKTGTGTDGELQFNGWSQMTLPGGSFYAASTNDWTGFRANNQFDINRSGALAKFNINSGGGPMYSIIADYGTGEVQHYTRTGGYYQTFYANDNLAFTLKATTQPQFNYLGGTGTRMVVADASGNLATQAIPSGGGSGLSGLTAGRLNFSTSSTTISDDSKLLFDNTDGKLTLLGTNSNQLEINGNNAARTSIIINSLNSGGNASIYTQNDRTTNFSGSYGGIATWGSAVSGNLLGVPKADRTTLLSDGVNSTGLAIGTLNDAPITFATNNTERASIFNSGDASIFRLKGGSPGTLSGSFHYDGPDISNASYGAFGVAQSGGYFGTTGVVLISSSKNGTGTQLPIVIGGYNSGWATWMGLSTSGLVTFPALASGLTAPSTSGTKHMMTVDVNGLVSHETIPSGGGSSNWSVSGNNIYNANAGLVVIGTVSTTVPTDANLKLAVNGNIYAQKLKITQTGWADYVFASSYKLRPLTEVETFIQKNQHLPEMPSAAEVEKNGIDVGDNQVVLLKKIEELTLYLIRQDKKLQQQQREISKLKKKIKG